MLSYKPLHLETIVGSLFECPTVGIPGSRQDSLMTKAQGRPKEDDVRPKIVDR